MLRTRIAPAAPPMMIPSGKSLSLSVALSGGSVVLLGECARVAVVADVIEGAPGVEGIVVFCALVVTTIVAAVAVAAAVAEVVAVVCVIKVRVFVNVDDAS